MWNINNKSSLLYQAYPLLETPDFYVDENISSHIHKLPLLGLSV